MTLWRPLPILKQCDMKRYVFLIILLFIQIISFCQYRIDWQNCYGTIHHDYIGGIVDTDDGFILRGDVINTAYTWSTGILLKINNEGDTIWQTTYDIMLDLCRMNNNDYIIMYADTLLYPGTYHGNIGLRRIDADRNTIWEKAYGNEFGMTSGSFMGCATYDGGYVGCSAYCYAGGDISHYWGGTADVWVIRVDGNGDMVWETSVGTTGCEFVNSIQQTTDGGFLMAITNIVPGTGNMMCEEHQKVNGIPYLVKLDHNGNVEWSSCYGGSRGTTINGVCVLDDGFLMYGSTIDDDGDFEGAGYHLGYHAGMPTHSRLTDAYLMKTDFDFNIIWCKCYGGRGSDSAIKVFQNDDGGFTVFAATHSIDGDVQSSCLMQHDPHYYIGLHREVSWIFRVDHNGELLWERIAGNSNNLYTGTYPRDVIKHNDKEYTVASRMTYYEEGWETYDINCPYNANMPGSGINFWVYHITDIFDYDDVGEIEDNENAVSLEIHPNPTQNTVNIKFSDDIECQSVEIYAIDGRLLKSQISNLETVDVSKLNAGIYILKVNMADGMEFTERIVKE